MDKVETTLRDALEDRILTGDIRPGARLDEAALAVEFNVSRTPVRQALFQLAATGLIEHIPHRGAFAAEIGPQQLSEMFEVIAELEALCARNCARRATAGDIADLMALAEAPAEDCAPAHEIARKQLAAVDRRLTILAQLRQELARMAEADDPGRAGECRVIEVLGDHRLCIGAHEA